MVLELFQKIVIEPATRVGDIFRSRTAQVRHSSLMLHIISSHTSLLFHIHRYSHIPICLFYSSLTKFFLLFLLSIWGTASPTASADLAMSTPPYKHTITFDSPTLQLAWGALDDDKLDREWVVRNVLGGMAAGFGLRGLFLHFLYYTLPY